MKKKTPIQRTDRVRRERDPLPWRYCILTLVCGLLLVSGFFLAARQHFLAMNFGINNAKLRKQLENLESEQRRLYLSKEISLSPGEIKKMAKKIGLQDLTAQSIEVMAPKNAAEKPLVNRSQQAFLSKAQADKAKELIADDKKADNKAKDAKDTKSKSSALPISNAHPQIAGK